MPNREPTRPPSRIPATIALLAALSWAAASFLMPPAGVGETSASPAQRTPVPTSPPPGGTWSLLHGVKRDPLWSVEPPVLRGIHGTTDPDGTWRGYAVGDDGAIVRFDGTSWTASRLDPGAGQTYNFQDVFVAAANDVWLVGSIIDGRNCVACGALLHFNGTTWRQLDGQEFGVVGKVAPLNAIDLIADGNGGWTGWIVGDDADFDNTKAAIIHLDEDAWTSWMGSNNIAKNLYDVKVISKDEAWVVGEGGAEAWYDARDGVGGWPRLGASGVDNLYALDLADQLFGWDGGAAGRMNHYSGSCHDDTLATQCWFDNQARPVKNASGQPLNMDVNDIDLRSRVYGWLVGAPQARTSLVAYLDGDYWRLTDVQNDPGENLLALHMVNDGFAYAVGSDGVILVYSDPNFPTPSPTPASATPTTGATHDPTSTRTPGGQDPATPTPSPTDQFQTSTPGTASPSATALDTPVPSVTNTAGPTQVPTLIPDATPSPVEAYRIFVPIVVTSRATM